MDGWGSNFVRATDETKLFAVGQRRDSLFWGSFWLTILGQLYVR